MTNNGTTRYRVDILEKRFNSMDKKMDELLENHLPHLKTDLESLKVRINTLTVVNVAAVILALLFGKYF